jgi:nitroreductase
MDAIKMLTERRSVRKFTDKEVTHETIEQIVEIARMAPSWKNNQESRYYIALSNEMIEKVYDALPAFNQKSTENAAYVVATYVKGLSGFSNGEPVDELGDKWGVYDAGLHNAYFILSARDRGYDTLIMGLRDEKKLREIFSIPEEEEILSVIAIGKRGEEPALRPRKPLEEIVKIY